MFNDFIATLVATIIAVSGAVADSTGQLTEELGDVLFPVTTSVSYARVPARPVHAPIGIVRGESTTTPSTSTTVITQPVIERVVGGFVAVRRLLCSLRLRVIVGGLGR